MNKYIRIILYVLVIWWMVIVFCFSHQESLQSTATSNQAIEIILNVLNINDMDLTEKQEIIKNLQLPIRKLAHFILYFVGGTILYLFFSTTKYSAKKRIGAAFGVAVIYSMFDECHQVFVPGRAGQITDVCIDSLGALVGIVIMYLIINMVYKKEV